MVLRAHLPSVVKAHGSTLAFVVRLGQVGFFVGQVVLGKAVGFGFWY